MFLVEQKLPILTKSSDLSSRCPSPGLLGSPGLSCVAAVQGFAVSLHTRVSGPRRANRVKAGRCASSAPSARGSLVPALLDEACLCSAALFLPFVRAHLPVCGIIPGLSTTPRVNADGQRGLWVMMCQRGFPGHEKCSFRGVC